MDRLVEMLIATVAIVVVVTIAAVVVLRVEGSEKRAARDRELERACLLAAGKARAHASWLDPGHPRREDGLLLLSQDAAWAPVCARDRGAGAELRSQIDAVLGQPDAPGAVSLAGQLILALENR